MCVYIVLIRTYSSSNTVVTFKSGLGIVTENGTIRKLGYGFPFAFHRNCTCHGSIFSRFGTIHERDGQTCSHPASDRTTAQVVLTHSVALQKRRLNPTIVPFKTFLL